ncbi:MAG: GumC family protein [Vicinamibacterales bacterium]
MAATPRGADGANRRAAHAVGGLAPPHLLDYLRVLSKRRWSAVAVFLAVFGGVAAYSWTVTPRYEAQTQIMIEAERPRLIVFREAIEQGPDSADYQQTQFRILQSRGLARRAIESLDLWNNRELLGTLEPASLPAKWLGKAGDAVGSLVERFSRSTPSAPKEPRGEDESREQAVVVDAFLANLSVTPVRGTRLVDVKYRSIDPELSAKASNALAQAYIDQNLEFKTEASREASDWLSKQLEEQRTQVEQSEARLQAYRERTESVSTNERENLGLQKLAELNNALTRARTDRIQRESIFRSLEAAEATPGAIDSWPGVTSHAGVQAASAEVEDARRNVSELAESLGERHPDMRKARQELEVAAQRRRAEITKVVEGIRNDYLAARALEQSLSEAVEGQKREALSLRANEIQFDALERDAVSDRQIFESLLQRTKEAGVSGELPSNNIRIVDAAVVPRVPFSPRKERNLLIGLLAGLALALGATLCLEYFDKRIKTPGTIKDHLDLPCLGLVPVVPRSAGGPLVTGDVPQHFAEAFRTIRTNILFASDGEASRSILVTSTGPHEGKTMVASNIAVALAQAGQSVLLVDADMRRPRVHKVFGVGLAGGLVDVLEGDGDPAPHIRPSGHAGLSLLTAGGLPPNPHELLSSPQFERTLKLLGGQYGWVLIDTPPVMPVSDAALIAHIAAGVLFVIGSEQTTIPAAANALEQLDAANARFVGAVLNMVQLDRDRFFYADVYRAEYGDYYRSAAPATPPALVAQRGRRS